MLNLNVQHAGLRSLFKEKQRALKIRDAAWQYFQLLSRTDKPKIEALIFKEKLLFSQANENFSFSKIAFRRKDHKAAKTFSKAAKRCMQLLKKTVDERRKLTQALKDAKEEYYIDDEQNRKINVKLEQCEQLCKCKRKHVLALAKVPKIYRDNASIVEYENGAMNIYFGGKGSPAGKGHGHICIDPSGNVRYTRNPWDEHGSHNYVQRNTLPEKNNSR
ncbi:hypothetical protein COV88_01540 [Candidatus Saccharibacteria bacterium CG11_big_fil_rev_8_21_14_0_20_41_19]|nr:hypothetical protein [Candidatus Saccharibacteria bacterium]OIP86364.1 MAG: hypothetical protein AUK57_01180 [Candidatus Saccharibacteria bacterium CG2_30_41_52]PIQ71147.1 MAG: hypothetical protein COV88_01540 [Candidatus Saccharibacteria bacterium CG11_big_fil_rev_8_21_14_0_20_41_19]PIZ59963.1 MAG: hypothetical protein COY18_02300 [Candidatus Saccharibacteria bacterium CG_4_10_14_0_2_um_filter_41_11]PJC29518.1 MAG: hypothetical protein CO052_02935 [Candidatus Saccharibacteria bacterium CG_4